MDSRLVYKLTFICIPLGNNVIQNFKASQLIKKLNL